MKILRPTREGETSTIQGIPYPQPEALEVRLGPETESAARPWSLWSTRSLQIPGEWYSLTLISGGAARAWTTVFGVTLGGLVTGERHNAPGKGGINRTGAGGLPPTPG